MKQIIVAAVLAAIFLPGQAAATGCAEGTVAAEYLARYLNRAGMTGSFILPEAHASAIVEKFNAIPPVTNWAPDRVTVYYNASHALLVLHLADCVASPGPVPGAVLDRFLRSVQPTPS